VTKVVLAILIAPCISTAQVDTAANSTDIHACAGTVRIEQRVTLSQLKFARHQGNAFRFMKAVAAK
jgi:hypothetical protein